MLWVGVIFSGLLVLDIWNRTKTKHKARNLIFIVVEGTIALGSIIWWLIK